MDEQKPSGTEDVIMQQGYPSPTVDEADVQYYEMDVQQEQRQAARRPDEMEVDGLSRVDHNEHHELQELQREIQDEPPPHHHHHQSSAEELQLAAQLTQDLAQGMNPVLEESHEVGHAHYTPEIQKFEAAQEQGYDASHEQHVHQQQQDHAAARNPAVERDQSSEETQHQETNLHHQIQAELQNHDRAMQQHGHHNHALPPQHSFVPTSQVAILAALPQPVNHLPSQLPSQHIGQSDFSMPDISLPRKRTKVSRACDECRRKKIRCDAPSEASDQPCSNCKRSSAQCLFSRVPQKRGPSKGYIKELADRINSIEGKLSSAGEPGLDSPARRVSADHFPSQMATDQGSRKRPFASISGDDFTTLVSERQWIPENRPIRPQQSPAEHPAYHSNNDLALKPLAPAMVQAPEPETETPSQSTPEIDGHVSNGFSQVESLGEINDAVFDAYHENIHRTLPILARSKARVQSILSLCPQALQQAFHEALHAMLSPLLPPDLVVPGKDARTALGHLKQWERVLPPQSNATDLVHLQILIMLIIESDNHGPETISRRPSKSSILWEATGLAISMKIHETQPNPVLHAGFDDDADEIVAYRAWWTLVMLDSWHAIGTASRLTIDNELVIILPGLRYIVGGVGFNMIQLAHFLRHIGPLSRKASPELSLDAGVMIGTTMNIVLDGFRVNFPPDCTLERVPTLHLAYWHTRLVYDLISPTTRSETLLQECDKLARILVSHSHLRNPLSHHFECLVALVLFELLKVDSTKEEAAILVQKMAESEIPISAWAKPVHDQLAEKSRPATAGALIQNLQQLADLATAAGPGSSADGDATADEPIVSFKRVGNYTGHGFDPLPLLRAGYLNAFRLPTGGD